MKKFLRKVENVLSIITCSAFSGAIFCLSLGALIWSVNWLFSLLGAM